MQVHPAQGALFPLPKPPVVIDYARPDGGSLIDEDFDRRQEIARAVSSLPSHRGKVAVPCR
ncbi:hypothetical protein AB0M39_39810 [Streptomyces sp. NPDC051907]|uniref:hypothetical protein n=1 Tax=Streptomyces sp. NPDC051907 TaxID=3155284 RepID=UPI003421E53D